MNDNKLTLTTKLELKEIVNACFYHLKNNGVFSDEEIEQGSYNYSRLKVKAFESLLATGLYYIMNDKDFKTDFDYLGNNNHITLLFDDIMLMQMMREEKQ